MKYKVGQKFRHFDGKRHCICVIIKIQDSKRIHLEALSDYYPIVWWDTKDAFNASNADYYYKLLTHYKSKLGRILYK